MQYYRYKMTKMFIPRRPNRSAHADDEEEEE